jgi:hypothetical protein
VPVQRDAKALSLAASAGQKTVTIGKSDSAIMQTLFGKENQDNSHGKSNHVAGEKS